MARPNLKPKDRVTIDEFLEFAAGRPDEERWELVEGVPLMNAAPTNYHQILCDNLVFALKQQALTNRARWFAMSGIGVRVPASPDSLPQPDVLVLPRLPSGPAATVAEDAVVVFEVLSKSNRAATMAWKQSVYLSIPGCLHYVTIAQDRCMIVRYDRAEDWKGVRLDRANDALELPALGASIALARIYDGVPVRTSVRRSN